MSSSNSAYKTPSQPSLTISPLCTSCPYWVKMQPQSHEDWDHPCSHLRRVLDHAQCLLSQLPLPKLSAVERRFERSPDSFPPRCAFSVSADGHTTYLSEKREVFCKGPFSLFSQSGRCSHLRCATLSSCMPISSTPGPCPPHPHPRAKQTLPLRAQFYLCIVRASSCPFPLGLQSMPTLYH